MRIILLGLLLLSACDSADQTGAAPVGGSATVQVEEDGKTKLSARLPNGAELAVACGKRTPYVYVDTRQDAESPPPLTGVFASFITDQDTFESEVSWATAPRGAWSVRQEAAAAGIAKAISRAQRLRFEPPKGFSKGIPIEWKIVLSNVDRARIIKACHPS